jgi:hypothetical protein
MCKDKWNSLNSNYTKLVNYHKRIRSHTSFWDQSFDEKENFHLSCQFNIEFYELIKSFKGGRSATPPFHVRDINVKNDKIHGLVLTVPKT